ncbi:hypothetical protein E4U55_004435 [Claviceps digitariae]|nr:hypothetical protein E4U55_004435 [Claviceps digitariae]
MTTFYQYRVTDGGVVYAIPIVQEQRGSPYGRSPESPFENFYQSPNGHLSNAVPVFFSNTTPSPAESTESTIDRPASTPIPDWDPDTQVISQGAKEAIKKDSIGYYLWLLEMLNINTSSQRWSEFPDDDPEDVETPGRYQMTGLHLRHFLDESCLVQCQRCRTICDLDFNIVEQNENNAARVAYVLPYVHCPLGSIRQCYNRSSPEWRAAQAMFTTTEKLQVCRALQRHLLKKRTTKISASDFAEDKIEPATREIFNSYRGLRVFWHRLLFRRHECPELFADEGDNEFVDNLPLWGDLITDVTLVKKSLIFEPHINFVYGITCRGADYLFRWQSEWTREILWLNTYVGMSRHAHMTSRHAPDWRTLAERVGRGLEFLVDAEEKINGTIDNLEAYREAKIQARALFRELHSWLMRDAVI